MKTIFIFSLIALLLSSSLAVNGALASPPQSHEQDDDDVNGPGGLMSIKGIQDQTPIPNDPLQIKAHHPAHVKKFVGSSVSLTGGQSPANVITAYGFNKLGCTFTTTTDWTDPNLCGHGQTIAIVDAYDHPNIVSDLQTFDTQFGLPACTDTNECFTKIKQGNPATNSGWAMEIALDVQWAHAVAPGAKIVLVESTTNSYSNLLTGVDMATATGAMQVSNSWGGSEFSGETSYDYHFNSPTASFYAASGDSGHGVIWPAASPYVVSVGGTTLTTDGSGNWLGETAWSGSGGGTSTYEPKPSYQNGFNSNSKRTVPDVAYDGDPNSGFYVYDSVPTNGQSGWWVVGGTSAGTPQWAAISAIANSQNANLVSASYAVQNALYGAASGAQSNPQTTPYLSNYHDIVSGSNGNCGVLCNAITGYDQVTGLGSPQTNNIVSFLTLPPSPDFAISSSPSTLSLVQGTSGQTTLTLTPSNGFTTLTLTAGTLPSGVTASFTPANLDLTSGTQTSILGITVDANTAVGTYPITITATGGGKTHSTTVNLTVTSSNPQQLSVGITTDKASYSTRSHAKITVSVSFNSTPISGATVAIQVKDPKTGTVSTGSGTTGSIGQITFSYNIPKNHVGTYYITATANAPNYLQGTATATFTAH